MKVINSNPVTAFELGHKLLLSKEYAKAEKSFKKAIDEGESKEICLYNIVLCKRLDGDKLRSNTEIYKALGQFPDSELLNSLNNSMCNENFNRNISPALSIIVPVYNSGKYLEKCLNSIVLQNFKDFELIIVNDGSTDNSGEIIDKFVNKDKRITVISNSKPSGNPGTPRNQALDKARGKYIGFVDSDDWIEPDFYSTLMDKAKSEFSDIVFCSGFFNEKPREKQVRKYSEKSLSQPHTTLYKFHESFMIWDKIFSSRVIQSFRIRLGETKAAVDVPFILKAYYYSHKFSVCKDYIGYHYRRESSSSVTVNYRKSSDCNFELIAFESVNQWAKSENVTTEFYKQIQYRKVTSFIYTLSVISPNMFDAFYKKVKEIFKEIDESTIARFTKETGKTHVLKKFRHVMGKDAKSYKIAYRKDIRRKEDKPDFKKLKSPVIDLCSFELKGSQKGIMFFPDWSAKNPYQKLLYAGIASNFDVNIKGYKESYLTKELLEQGKEQFNCIHVHWLHVHIDFSRDDGANKFIETISYAKKLGYTIIYTAHNIISHESGNVDLERKLRQDVISLFDHVLVHGELAKSRVINEIGANPDCVSIVPHGSYEGYYPNFCNNKIARKHFSISEDTFVYLFFGNIKGYKGVDKLLEAYDRVYRSHPNSILLIAGRIFDTEAAELIAKHTANNPSIVCKLGFVEEHEVQYYFKCANVVVLPYKKILTSGAATLSFAFKKRVIAPKTGLLPEFIEDGKQGFLFDNFSHMESLMLEVQKNPNLQNPFTDFDELNKSLLWSNITAGKPFNKLFSARDSHLVGTNKDYKYALIRILGNDLPQRHASDQTFKNLEFTLKNETDFSGCIKIWVLNRIIDSDKCLALKKILEKYGKEYIEIPYSPIELVNKPFCFEDLPVDDFILTNEFEALSERNKVVVETAILKHKNNYIMNNNGARNKALEVGKARANWVFPWDGNCFLTDQAWESIISSLHNRADAHYHIVPMDRVLSNDDLLSINYSPKPYEEPQVIFSSEATKTFNENLMYGLKPKVDLLKRLGVPGVWDKWKNLYPWKKHIIEFDCDAYNYAWSGWTARLFSGKHSQELNSHERAVNREKGIVSYIKDHDKAERFKKFNKDRLAYYNESLLLQLRDDDSLYPALSSSLSLLKKNASIFVHNNSYSVVNKTTLPPSEDIHDYWHPAPYAWPNPDTSDGLPYIHKDGQRVPGTRMYEEASIKYDRTSLQKLFDETTTLALAGHVFSIEEFSKKAYQNVKTWFIDSDTAMNPNFNFAQVVMGRNDNRGTASGLIEMKDLYFFLDAIRLVKRTKFWSEHDDKTIQTWFRKYYIWLNESLQGKQELRAKNNHGNAYDLQCFAIASFLGMTDEMYEIYKRSSSRIKAHVLSNGEQPHEMKRTTTAHYTAFNLHLWLGLDMLVKNTIGASFFTTLQYYGEERVVALESAAEWVLSHGVLADWPFKQIDYFDKSRYEHIYNSLLYSGNSAMKRYSSFYSNLGDAKDLYFPHDGIAPFWKLSLPLEISN